MFSTTTTTRPSSAHAPTREPVASATVDTTWSTNHVVEFDPHTLEAIGPLVPSGNWVEGAVLTEDLIALSTWPEEELIGAEGRWRLVVADRSTGRLQTTDRVGGMNVLGVLADNEGGVLVVEPIRSADWNFADGFVIHGFRADISSIEQIARFAFGDFAPNSIVDLGDGRIGLYGSERNQAGEFDRLRLIVFDVNLGQAITDVLLDHLPVRLEDPAYPYLDDLRHAVVWDTVRSRALVVHAGEDAVTSIDYPSGHVEVSSLALDASLLERLALFWIPRAQAKGLPSMERHAVISGDRLYVAGVATVFAESESGLRYTTAPTGLMAIDLDSLHVVKASEAPVGFLAASSEGGYLLGGGKVEAGSAGESLTLEEETSSGLLVIDPESLEVVEQHQVDIWASWAFRSAPGQSVIYIDGGESGILRFDPLRSRLESTGVKVPWEPALLEQGLRYVGQPS